MTAVFNVIQELNPADWIKFMCSEPATQELKLLHFWEKKGKNLNSLAYRHHIVELIDAKVFETLMGPSSGPNIKLFQRFGEYWTLFDRFSYESGLDVDFIAPAPMPVRDDLIQFSQHQLIEFQPRDNYLSIFRCHTYFSEQSPMETQAFMFP